jgi:hypothetical protein
VLIWLAGCVPSLAGCAPSLATLQPAHVAPRGHAQVTAGFEIGIPSGTIVRVVDVARNLAVAAERRQLSDAELLQLFDAGVNLATSPPSVGQHFAAAYSFHERSEIGIRNAGGSWRVGGRYQFLEHQDGPFDLVVGLGAARATSAFPVGRVIGALEVRDFTRWTLDLPILIGTSRNWFRVWVGPRLLYSRFDTALALTLPQNPTTTASLEGHALYVGAQGGVAVGYQAVFLGVELTLGELSGTATASTSLFSAPRHSTDISGFVVYPAFALMGEF